MPEAPAAPQSPTVALFQKAHAKMVTLARIDEQLQALLDQRKRLQDELRGVQTQINDEFNRVMAADAKAAPANLLAQIAVSATAAAPQQVAVPAPKRNGATKPAPRLEPAAV